MHSLYIVEDDSHIRSELSVLLKRNGYAVQACEAFDHVIEDILSSESDLVLLDLNLPGIDGHFICKQLREKTDILIIVVTSRESEMDELLSMNFGADDFVTKPYNTQILLARIASLLKRAYGESTSNQIKYHNLILDTARCSVSYKNNSAELTKNEMRILSLLMKHSGEVVLRRTIQDELWQSNEFVDDNTLTVNVSHLRTTLNNIGAQDYIQTRRGLGYILEKEQ